MIDDRYAIVPAGTARDEDYRFYIAPEKHEEAVARGYVLRDPIVAKEIPFSAESSGVAFGSGLPAIKIGKPFIPNNRHGRRRSKVKP